MMGSFVLTLTSLAVAAETAGAPLRPERAESLFVEPGQAVVLRWRVERDVSAGEIRYTIRDFHDREVGAGTAERPDAKTVAATVTLAQGYYEIEFAGIGQRFGVVALPEASPTPDAFFCIDSAMSWLVRDGKLRESLVRILRRSGIAMSRERLNWGEIQPARQRFDWQGRNGYETVRQLHAEQGVSVLEMFHNATPWSGTVGKYPEDLIGTEAAWREITRRWRKTWGALEVWNEPDIFFGDLLPADQYVALVKTLGYAVDREAADLTLVGGVMAHYHRGFLDTAAQCGMLDGVDVFSFHTYDRAARMEELVGKYRDWLAAHGRPDMPLWITECGRPWKRGPGRPPVEQDVASGLDITRKAVEARACGIARYFAFVYPFYEENANNFGMMDRHGAPLRSFAAYVQAARVLGGKQYLGDLRLSDSLPAARVFGDDRETVVVVAASGDGQPAKISVGLPVTRSEGLDGRPLAATAEGEVPLTDGLAYVWLERNAFAQRLDTASKTRRLWQLGQPASRPRRPASPIVLRWQIDPAAVKAETAGYRLVSQEPGKLRVVVRAFNLSQQAADLRLALDFGQAAGRVLSENLCAVKVPASGFADAAWDVDLSAAFTRHNEIAVTVRPAGDAAQQASPVVVKLIGERTIAQCLGRHARHVRLPLGEAARWKPNVPSYGRLNLEPQPDGSVRMDVRFTQGDRWVYPYFALPDDVDMSRYSALVLRARCERSATVRVFLWEGDRGVGYLTAGGIVPADGKWHVAEVPFTDLTLSSANAPDADGRLDLGQVRRISFGMNSDAAENRLEISEAYLVGRQEAAK